MIGNYTHRKMQSKVFLWDSVSLQLLWCIGQKEATATRHVVRFLNVAAKLTESFPRRAGDKSIKVA